MKKIYAVLLIVICGFTTSNAQKQCNNWYFGNNAGLNFNSGSPVAIINSAMNTSEGCSSISDTNGNLLFYTDGSTIWNSINVPMPNGTGLSGNTTSTQSALIVKQPGTNLYYVFTTYTTLNYSIVDMTLDGGLGNVTSSKNVFMINSAEKLTATKHANGTDVWIVMHEESTNGFNAFLLTSAGVNLTPVHSNDGFAPAWDYGQMKISVDGKKIAFGVYDGGANDTTIYSGNFDNSTGIVSGGFGIPTSYSQTYEIEFSPDGSKLYSSANPFVYQIYQFNLNAGSPSAIIASSTLIGSSPGEDATGLQLGPDKKIYLSADGNSYIDVINDPDSAGTACNFVHEAVYLSGKLCYLGLPACVYNNFATVLPPVAAFESNDSSICANDCINFTNLSTNATAWQWRFAGGSPDASTDQNPQVCYLTRGIYNVSLIASNSGGNDSVTFSNYINVKSSPSTPVITQRQDTLYCSTDTSYTGYQWYSDSSIINGATDTLLVVSESGNYNLQVTNSGGCKIAVGINVILGIQNYSSNNILSLSPNPAESELRIMNPASGGTGSELRIKTIVIYNVLGQPVYQSSISNKQSAINVSGFPSGVYFMQVSSESGLWVGRFVKE